MAPSGRVVAAGGSLLRRNRKAALELTDEAARRVRELLQAKGETVEGVRISLRNRGCNGKSFVMNYVEKGKENKHDEVVLDKGVKLFVDPRALMQVVGTTMDFVDSEIASEFVFYNPNAKVGQSSYNEYDGVGIDEYWIEYLWLWRKFQRMTSTWKV